LTWLTLTAGTVTVNKDVLGTATVFIRITDNTAATADTNSFTVTVTCVTPTTIAITNPATYIIANPAVASTSWAAPLSYTVVTSAVAFCPLTYTL